MNTQTQATNGAKAIVENALGGDGDAVGYLCWWSLFGCDIPRADLIAWAAQHGLEKAVRDPGAITLLRRAEGDVAVGKKHVLFRPLTKDKGAAEHAALLQTFDAAGRKTGYEQLWRVSVDRYSGTLSIDGSDSLAGELAAVYHKSLVDAETRDISDAIVRVMDILRAVPLRESGGVYFVDARNATQLHALADFVGKLGGSTFNIFKVRDSGEQMQVATATAGSLTAKLAKLKAELSDFAATDGKNKDYSMRVRAERFASLRADVDFYADLLGDVAAELRTQIDQAKRQLEDALAL